jgi:hypothetical protein
VRAYLKRIGGSALLTAEQEVEHAKRIEAGLYAAERPRCAPDQHVDSPKMRRDLSRTVRDGQRAKNNLLKSNLRLVVSVAKRYVGWAVPFLLIQEGNLGLRRAVEKFEEIDRPDRRERRAKDESEPLDESRLGHLLGASLDRAATRRGEGIAIIATYESLGVDAGEGAVGGYRGRGAHAGVVEP